MARNNKGAKSTTLATYITNIRDRMNSIYRDTYSADPERSQTLDTITDDIEQAVSNIIDRSANDISGISSLYTKLKLDKTMSDSKYTDSVIGYFENSELVNQLITTYMDNHYLKEFDLEIDTVCKYMPKLDEALEGIKDAVLSADNFEKEFCTFNSATIAPKEVSTFTKRMNSIKKAYNADQEIEKWYDYASKYGEAIVYNVPYSKAITALLDKQRNFGMGSNARLHESVEIFNENSYIGNKDASVALTKAVKGFNDPSVQLNRSLYIQVNNTGLLESAITEAKTVKDLAPVVESMCVEEQARLLTEAKMDKTIPDKLEVPKDVESMSNDGLISSYNKSSTEKIKSPGVLLKMLDHSNVILLYMGDVCLGYYYMEFLNEDGDLLYTETVFKKNVGTRNLAQETDKINQNTATSEILKFISARLIDQIDPKFINANPDLTKEIYSILDYNDIVSNSQLSTIRLTFIPPQDIEHIKFNEDPKTHRGISDLARALIPAKLWCCLYITYTIGMLTRGQDKRVYYVKQSVEQNIAQTLLNVIEQIKKNNFNIMQIENMNSILNMTGQFNDYVIPVGMSGDPPINMEVLQGQDINPQNEFMDKLEEITINSTRYKYEWLTAKTQIDFAAQITMTNNSFMRFVYKRQTKYETNLANIFSKIYNVEYPDDTYLDVECVLPAPITFSLNNFTQILQTVTEQGQQLAQLEYPDTEDPTTQLKQSMFVNEYVKTKLAGYYKQFEIDMIKNNVEISYGLKYKKANNDEE